MSKKVFQHPAPREGAVQHWRSLEERNKSPEFLTRAEREFVDGASTAPTPVERREFLTLMGASFGLAGLGLAGCREPRHHTLPYAKQPENTIPGIPTYYASSFPGEFASQPLIVETHQHRPTKVEGNPSHAASGRASSKFAQASVLDLYDPDRAKASYDRQGPLSREAARKALQALAAESLSAGGEGLVFLVRPSSSPTRLRLAQAVRAAMPKARWIEYTPVRQDRAESALGARALPDFAKARRILSLDADFLGAGDAVLEATRAYTEGRRAETVAEAERMTRLYVAESLFTLTGAAADHRLRVPSSHMSALAAAFAAEVLRQTGGDASRVRVSGLKVEQKWITECVRDLVEQKGRSLIVAGDHLSPEAHRAVAFANAALGAPVRYVASAARVANAGLADLASRPARTLVILGGNPAYDGPADVRFAAAVKAAAKVVRLGYHGAEFDETSALAREAGGIVLAASHYLESWSDGRTVDGTVVPVQPMIEPLFPSFGELDVLAPFAGSDKDAAGLVRETFGQLSKDASDAAYSAWLAEGVLRGTAFPAARVEPASAAGDYAAPAVSLDSLEARIVPSAHAGDGLLANNGWLSEAPDPLTRTAWENVILVSPRLAAKLSIDPVASKISELGALNRNINAVEDGKLMCRVARLTVGGATVTGPLFIMPGLAAGTVGLQLGFGRRLGGRVATRVDARLRGEVLGNGFSAYPLVSAAEPDVRTGVRLELTAERIQVCNLQDHWSMEGRDVLREGTVEDLRAGTDFAKLGVDGHAPAVYGKDGAMTPALKAVTTPRGNSAYEHPDHTVLPNVAVWRGHEDKFPAPQQWGMSIDLSTCTGCNACVTACQAENNIPVVGRDQVFKGRSMHWLRLDRYFSDGREHAGLEIP
ncbi:MAG: TAT-variant-translocated molybdopterin oxidoreductase, partial [Opitutales bacterium]